MATTSYCLCNMRRKSTLRLMRLLDYVFLLGASNFDLIARRVMIYGNKHVFEQVCTL